MKKTFLSVIFLYAFSTLSAQDRVILLSGSSIEGKVLEIGPDLVTIDALESEETVAGQKMVRRADILLIEYKNGFVETYNRPGKAVVYNAAETVNPKLKKRGDDILPDNLVYINTLALCNADISGFFERLSPTRKMGLGIMAAYNFNIIANLGNPFIAILNNGKKNYDIGAFANFYPRHFSKRSGIYYGIFFKYTSLRFMSIVEQKQGNASVLSYTPSTGHQMATIFTFGTHTAVAKDFYIRTLVGIGGFFLKGSYKQQWNYIMNQDLKPGERPINYSFLPKIYLGLNAGFNF